MLLYKMWGNLIIGISNMPQNPVHWR